MILNFGINGKAYRFFTFGLWYIDFNNGVDIVNFIYFGKPEIDFFFTGEKEY